MKKVSKPIGIVKLFDDSPFGHNRSSSFIRIAFVILISLANTSLANAQDSLHVFYCRNKSYTVPNNWKTNDSLCVDWTEGHSCMYFNHSNSILNMTCHGMSTSLNLAKATNTLALDTLSYNYLQIIHAVQVSEKDTLIKVEVLNYKAPESPLEITIYYFDHCTDDYLKLIYQIGVLNRKWD